MTIARKSSRRSEDKPLIAVRGRRATKDYPVRGLTEEQIAKFLAHVNDCRGRMKVPG